MMLVGDILVQVGRQLPGAICASVIGSGEPRQRFAWADEPPAPPSEECRKVKVAERREPSGVEEDIQQNTGRLAPHRYNYSRHCT